MLTQTLEQNVWMDVALSEKSDAVQNAATFLLRVGKQPEILLPVGTTISDIYDQGSAHDLLILGEPGTGKSTLLLKLAQQLVKRAASDSEHPLPVILSLSSWKAKRSSLQDWMIDEIVATYHISHQVSEQWVRGGTILPLLDGFDEMDETARPMGITEINKYHTHQAYMHIPLVVCSRTDAYDVAAQHKRLFLQRVVVVQPLTHQQVGVYLLQAGKPVAALRSAIKKNPALQKLATTPLMLSVLMHTYQGTVVRELPRKQALLEQEVWSDYIIRMVQRKGKRKGDANQYSLEQTRRWLIYLAQQLQMQKQPIFSVEHLQIDWLSTQQRVLYQWSVGLSTGLGTGLVLGLCLGFAFGVFFGPLIGLIVGLGVGLGGGLLAGLVLG